MDTGKEQGASGGDNFRSLDPHPLSGCAGYPNRLEVSPISQPAPPYSVIRNSSAQPSYLGSLYETPLIIQQPAKYRSFVCPILLSVVVFLFCGFVFGFIAFIIALCGQKAAAKGQASKADKLARVSYGFSIAGLIIAIILIVVLGLVYGSIFMECHNPSCWYGSYTYADSYPPGSMYQDFRECRYCCDYYDYTTCRNNGFYLDYNGCKRCCSYSSTNCPYGVYYDSNRCVSCCDYFYASNCDSYGWKFDSKGCRTCCRYSDDASLCKSHLDPGLTTTYNRIVARK